MGFFEGIDIIKGVAVNLPESPGVYRMLGQNDDVLYVGKAKALRRRVTSYTQAERLTARLKRMVSETLRMEIIHTHTEVEALLLEANLIKKLRPRYNILLKDDKSFPYIHITDGHDFPRVEKYRGAQKEGGDYFGPFASTVSVNDTIATLQRAFYLRNCSDTIFASRTRPCLQYHIKRCTAPCVGYVTPEAYGAQVAEAREFLKGDSRKIVDKFAKAMQEASDAMNYEEAAKYRDRVRALSHIQLRQDVNVQGLGDADVFALARDGSGVCVQVFFFRTGQNFGNKSY
ncbi:MAG: excinuclease ABC subunit UvrC, partial [Alphaproteobacteria bacterium]|nr:excinuclease ABC subunit UvrC [Alphaproteobacteria bacterium]